MTLSAEGGSWAADALDATARLRAGGMKNERRDRRPKKRRLLNHRKRKGFSLSTHWHTPYSLARDKRTPSRRRVAGVLSASISPNTTRRPPLRASQRQYMRLWLLLSLAVSAAAALGVLAGSPTAPSGSLGLSASSCADVLQCALLVELYQATGGLAWKNNDGWAQAAAGNASADVCAFFAVLCDKDGTTIRGMCVALSLLSQVLLCSLLTTSPPAISRTTR
jgi:hypothetical protein